jgi:hypothetical protein
LIWLSRRVHWVDVMQRAVDVGARNMVLSFVALLASVYIAAHRWRLMMAAYGATALPPSLTLFRHNLVGLYFNVLPSGVAGDAVRALRMREAMGGLAPALTVVFLERVAGLLGLCTVAAMAMIFSQNLHNDAVAWVLEVGLLGALALSFVLLAGPWALARSTRLKNLVERVPLFGAAVLRIPPARSYARLVLAVLESVSIQSLVVLAVALLVQPLAPDLTLLVCARVVPAVILTTYIPMTPGGLGQRELAFRYLFGLVGVAPDAAIATSLLMFAELMALSALGGLCLVAERMFRLTLSGGAPPSAP